jgi:hypothetical protein
LTGVAVARLGAAAATSSADRGGSEVGWGAALDEREENRCEDGERAALVGDEVKPNTAITLLAPLAGAATPAPATPLEATAAAENSAFTLIR